MKDWKRSNEKVEKGQKRSKFRDEICGRQTTEEVPTTLCPSLVEAERSFVKNVEVCHKGFSVHLPNVPYNLNLTI